MVKTTAFLCPSHTFHLIRCKRMSGILGDESLFNRRRKKLWIAFDHLIQPLSKRTWFVNDLLVSFQLDGQRNALRCFCDIQLASGCPTTGSWHCLTDALRNTDRFSALRAQPMLRCINSERKTLMSPYKHPMPPSGIQEEAQSRHVGGADFR